MVMLLASRSCYLHCGPGHCGFRAGLSFAALEAKFLSLCSSFSAQVNLIRPTHSPEITSVSQVPNNSSVLENFFCCPEISASVAPSQVSWGNQIAWKKAVCGNQVRLRA